MSASFPEQPEQPEPDTADWTWVLARPCPDCGYDAAAVPATSVADRIRSDAEAWTRIALAPGAERRPRPRVWSPLEYACHVRDVHEVFAGRVRLMLDEEDPAFPSWDQDATALEHDYASAVPADAVEGLRAAAETVAGLYDAVAAGPSARWERTGRRGDGSVFTLDSLARYHLHDLVHHRWDVGG